jgi:dethiobiotin synthetase
MFTPLKGFFVTGTDTGVGKTFVTCALARHARSTGHQVFAFKPIETGCQDVEGRRVGADQELLAEAAGGWQQGLLRGLYRFSKPAAPLVAAEAEGESVDLDVIARLLREGAQKVDLVLVEGAGGWKVPITQTADMSTLARRTGLPVIVVARAGLGTINHSLLTVEAVERVDVPVHALVLSVLPGDDPDFAASNAEQLSRRWSGRVMLLRSPADVAELL